VPTDQTLFTVNSLTVNGAMDITNNAVQINYGSAANDPITTIRADLSAAYTANYAGAGLAITSSTAAARPGAFVIGYVDNTAADQLKFALTVPGDANLDGTTNFNDLLLVAQHFGQSTAKGNTVSWSTGDVNYDNFINFNDLLIIAQHFGDTLAKAEAPQPLILSAAVEYIRLDADGQHVDIWNNATASGTPAQSILLSTISSVSYAGPAGGDQVIVDFSNGDPLPPSGLSFAGGSATNTLEVIGTTGNDAATVNGSTISIAAPFGASSITYAGANTIIFNGDNSGADTLTQTAAPGGGANLVFAGFTALDTLNVNGGTFTVPAGAAGGGIFTYTLGTVSVAAGAKLVLSPSDVPADQTLFTVNSLTVIGAMDITDNAVQISYGSPANDPVATIRSDLSAAYAANFAGANLLITSSTAASKPSAFAIGYVDNTATDQLKFALTVPGDANLDGTTNFNDLLLVAQHFGQSTAKGNTVSWSTGDVNYDNNINFNDLLIIAQNFGNSLAKAEAALLPPAIVASVAAPAPSLAISSSVTPSVQIPSAAAPTIAPTIALSAIAPIETKRNFTLAPFAGATVADAPVTRPARTRIVVASAPAMPTDAIANDALVGVWNGISAGPDAPFSDRRRRDRQLFDIH
jgi:hypothetical protein